MGSKEEMVDNQRQSRYVNKEKHERLIGRKVSQRETMKSRLLSKSG